MPLPKNSANTMKIEIPAPITIPVKGWEIGQSFPSLAQLEIKIKRKEVKIEEIVEEVSKKKDKSPQPKNLNPVGFLIFILISGFLGLIASSLIFNLFSDSSQNQTPKQELIKKTK